MKYKFNIGDIVTLKSHPLAYQEDGEIDAYVNQIPPFMRVKEIHIEKKKQIFSSEMPNAKIADNIKYLCVYFILGKKIGAPLNRECWPISF